MLKREVREKSDKVKVNRKLLFWLFVFTGLLSLFFWWRGKIIHGGSRVVDNNTGDIRIVIEPTETVKVNSKSEKFKKVIDEIGEITSTASGTYAVFVYHLDDKTAYGINETKVMPGASLMKIPLFITVINKIERGELKFEDKYILEEADRTTGSGPLQFKKAGTNYTINELLTYLGRNSDNTAWVMFNRRLGKKAIQATINDLGLTDSNYDQLTTSATDIGKMWTYLYSGNITNADREKVWGYLTDSIYEDRIPAGLSGTGAQIVGHKVGTDVDVWGDAGVVKCEVLSAKCKAKPFILVILNEKVKRAEAVNTVPQIAKLVWESENRPSL